MILVHFQGKESNMALVQVCASTTKAKEAELFCENLQDLLDLTPKQEAIFTIGNSNTK